MSEQYKEILERLDRLELLLLKHVTLNSDEAEPFEGEMPSVRSLDVDLSEFSFLLDDEQTSDAADFESFIDDLQLQYFKGHEFRRFWDSRKGDVKNSPPPPERWGNIVPSLVVLDRFRDELSAPIRITSCYRSEDYNRAVGGVDNSQHVQCMAIDFQSSKDSPQAWAEKLKSYRGQTFINPSTNESFEFHGGIGTYNSFVHIDCRGRDVDW